MSDAIDLVLQGIQTKQQLHELIDKLSDDAQVVLLKREPWPDKPGRALFDVSAFNVGLDAIFAMLIAAQHTVMATELRKGDES